MRWPRRCEHPSASCRAGALAVNRAVVPVGVGLGSSAGPTSTSDRHRLDVPGALAYRAGERNGIPADAARG